MMFRLVILFIGAVILGNHLSAQTRIDTVLTMSDGVRIDVTYIVPSIPKPPAGFPCIFKVHGLGGSKSVNTAVSLARKGYVGVVYSVRGQGNSEGLRTLNGAREKQDLREILEFIKMNAPVDSGRVGINGASQGGQHSWWAAMEHMGFKTAVPENAVPGGITTSNVFPTRLLATFRNSRVRFSAEWDTLYTAVRIDDVEKARSFFENSDEKITSIDIPILFQMAWWDQLFDVTRGIQVFERVPGTKYLYLGTGGHGSPVSQREAQFRSNRVNRWFDYWLKGEQNGIDTEDPVVLAITDNWQHFTAKTWPLPQVRKTTLWFTPDGKLSLYPIRTIDSMRFGQRLSRPYGFDDADADHWGPKAVAVFAQDTLVFSTVVVHNATWTGVPEVVVTARSDGNPYQIVVQLYQRNRDGKRIWLQNGAFGVRAGDGPGTWREFRFFCKALGHRFDGALEVVIRSLDVYEGRSLVHIPFFNTARCYLKVGGTNGSRIVMPIIVPPSSVGDDGARRGPAMFDAYPNPVPSLSGKARLRLRFELDRPGPVRVSAWNMLGQRVASSLLVCDKPGAQSHWIELPRVKAGIYILTLHRRGHPLVRKLFVR